MFRTEQIFLIRAVNSSADAHVQLPSLSQRGVPSWRYVTANYAEHAVTDGEGDPGPAARSHQRWAP